MVEKIMVKKNIFRTISRIIKVALFSLCLTSCDSLYDSVFDMLLKDTIESEVPYKEASVEKRNLESIYIKENPVKTVYGIGDEFSTENICVIAKYSNGSELDVTNYVSYTGFNSSEENAEILITLSYLENGITAITTFTVAVFNNYIKVQSLVFEDDYKNSVIGLGNSRQLQVTVLPENANVKAVNWKSSDPSIASVTKDGVVTALKEGFVTITAISVDNPEVKAECSVEAKYYHAESVQINEPEELVRIEETKTGQLTARVLPELASQKVNWKSADTSIATVDNAGVITGVKSGSVQIIAMAADDETKTDSYTVEIFKYPVTSIQIMDEEGNDIPETGLTVFVDGSAKLTAAVNEDATHKEYTWSSGDENIAAVDSDGLVSGINGGSTTITATSVDNHEIVAVCTVTIDEITPLASQDYQIGDVILKDGTFVSYNDVASMTSEQKAKAVAVIYGYRLETTETGTESYALGIALDHANGLAWCKSSSPGYDMNFSELNSSYSSDYIYDSEGNRVYTTRFTGNANGSDDWEYICSMDSEGTADPATYYPAWDYVINYGENKGLKGYYKTGWYMPTLKEIYYLYQNFSNINSYIQKAGGKKLDSSGNYNLYHYFTSCARTENRVRTLYYYDGRIEFSSRSFTDTSYSSVFAIKAFPCSVAHYDDYTSKTISVTYPSYSGGDIILTSQADDDGNYTFVVTNSDSTALPENATYRWLLDTMLINEAIGDNVSVSENGTVLTLVKEYLITLVSGSHVITVLQQTEDGNFFDASCCITITDGTESNFTPQGQAITVAVPIYQESALTIEVQNNDDGSYAFTANDSSQTYTKYTWMLDKEVLSQNTATITVEAEKIERLSTGAHLLSLLAKTDDGEYFDASCYIKQYEAYEKPVSYELHSPRIYWDTNLKFNWFSMPYATGYKIYKYSSAEDLDLNAIDSSLFTLETSVSGTTYTTSVPASGYVYYAVKTCSNTEESDEISNVIRIGKVDSSALIESHENQLYYFVKDNGVWKSNNTGVEDSDAYSTWTISPGIECYYTFDWVVSGYRGDAYLSIRVNGNSMVDACAINSGTVTGKLKESSNTITAYYRNYGYTTDGTDYATITFRDFYTLSE